MTKLDVNILKKEPGDKLVRFIDIDSLFLSLKHSNPLFPARVSGENWFEGCQCVGYVKNGDSFVFTQGMGSDHLPASRRNYFCISSNFLKRLLGVDIITEPPGGLFRRLWHIISGLL